MTIDPKISEYIDFAIARQSKISDAKFDTILAKWDAKFEAERVAWDTKFNKERDIANAKWDAKLEAERVSWDTKFNKERDIANAKWDAKFEAERVAWDTKFNKERDISYAKWDAKFYEERDKSNAKWDAKFKEDREIANADSERHMGMLLEQFQDRLQIVKEWVKDLPTRDEVRTMIQDETNPIRRDIAMFKIELINLRKDTDIRLTRLEHKIA